VEARFLAVLLYDDIGGAVDVDVGGHLRGFGAVMFESICLRDRSTGILLPVSSGCCAANFSGRLRCLRKRLSATFRTGDDLLSQVIILGRTLWAEVLHPTV
jgi:hypothetical protein